MPASAPHTLLDDSNYQPGRLAQPRPGLVDYEKWRSGFLPRLDSAQDVAHAVSTAAPHIAPPHGWGKMRIKQVVHFDNSMPYEQEYQDGLRQLAEEAQQGGDDRARAAWQEFEEAKKSYSQFQGRMYLPVAPGAYRPLLRRDSDIVKSDEAQRLARRVAAAEREFERAAAQWRRDAVRRLSELERIVEFARRDAGRNRPIRIANGDADSIRRFNERVLSRPERRAPRFGDEKGEGSGPEAKSSGLMLPPPVKARPIRRRFSRRSRKRITFDR